ncbi:MAG TPA: hypothetical protein PLD49_11055 [Thermoclostridium caenicola]|nr:hypothetical protein [Thermoclostridium caenicola]
MNRDMLFAIARKYGHEPGTGLTEQVRDGIKKELLEYFGTVEGRGALDRAPSWFKSKPIEEIVDLLIQEVE